MVERVAQRGLVATMPGRSVFRPKRKFIASIVRISTADRSGSVLGNMLCGTSAAGDRSSKITPAFAYRYPGCHNCAAARRADEMSIMVSATGSIPKLFTIPNQSSVAKAFLEFDEVGRMKPSAYYDRVVDVMEELVKFTLLIRDHAPYLVDRYSERKESPEALSTRVNQRSI